MEFIIWFWNAGELLMILGISIVVYNENVVTFANCLKLCKEIKSSKKPSEKPGKSHKNPVKKL